MAGLAPIAFVHIPRTGGTSIRRALLNEHGPFVHFVKVPPGGSVDDIPPIPKHAKIIAGHMPWGLHARRPVRYATVLREPIDRTASQYALYGEQMARRGRVGSFEHFLEEEPGLAPMTDVQTTMIAGAGDGDMLERAKANLAQAWAIGEHRLIAGFVRNWLEVEEMPVPSVNGFPRPDLTRAQLAELEARNALDIELYRWAGDHLGFSH